MFSFGFQHAVGRGLKRDGVFFERVRLLLCPYHLSPRIGSSQTTCGVITTLKECMAPTSCMYFALDGHFDFTSFLAASLLKLLRPAFAGILGRALGENILTICLPL